MVETRTLNFLELSEEFNHTPMSAGQFLADYFKREGITTRDAGQKIGCDHSTVARLLKGGELSIDMAVKVSNAYGFSVEALFNSEASHKTYLALKKQKKQ